MPSRPEEIETRGRRLHALQSELRDYLLRRGATVEVRVRDGARAGAQECLEIYAEAYRLRLTGVLRSDYPALRALVGEDDFNGIASAYLERHPSHHFSVRHVGGKLGSYLANDPAWRDRPWLGELAALEWALGEAFDAADQEPLVEAEIAAIPPDAWGELRLDLHPSLRRLGVRTNAPVLRRAFNQGQPLPVPTVADEPSPWLIWRKALETYFRALVPDEAWALDAAHRGASFGDICEGLCDWNDEDRAALRAAGLLRRWLNDGLVTAARVAA
jgi:hypothetical protein